MKNKKLRSLMAQKNEVSPSNAPDVTILNEDILAKLIGGSSLTECPNLKQCGTFADCNIKCTINA
jgi:hypothetical protein